MDPFLCCAPSLKSAWRLSCLRSVLGPKREGVHCWALLAVCPRVSCEHWGLQSRALSPLQVSPDAVEKHLVSQPRQKTRWPQRKPSMSPPHQWLPSLHPP